MMTKMPSAARIAVGAVLACVAVVVTAGAASIRHAPSMTEDPCVTGVLRVVELAEDTAVNAILVRVADSSPEDGATDVRVAAGQGERVMHIWGAGSQTLEFEPALEGARFEVAIDPVVDAPTSACVAEVVLLDDGEAVAVVAGQ